MSLLPIAVDSKNCPVCPTCPDPTVCPVYETKTYMKTITCEERGYTYSTITIFKTVVLKDSIISLVKYIGVVNHEMAPFIITTEQHNFCYCYVKMVGDQLIYNKGLGEKTITDVEWVEI
jgi:hypothetical protein